MTKDETRELFYGMTMDEWKKTYQTDAGDAQQQAFVKAFAENVGTKK